MHLPRDVLDSIDRARPAAELRSVWCVETEVWWERRLYRFKGAIETGRDQDEIGFGSLRLPASELPDRWSLAFDRPDLFQSSSFRTTVQAAVSELEIDVLFGVRMIAHTLGDPGFPMAFRKQLPVHARFDGVDSVPVMAKRGGNPYREASMPSDRADIPKDVMQSIRGLVRRIELPGYSDRIHGWRTLVHGGPVLHLRYALPLPLPSGAIQFVAVVLENANAVYAPDLAGTSTR